MLCISPRMLVLKHSQSPEPNIHVRYLIYITIISQEHTLTIRSVLRRNGTVPRPLIIGLLTSALKVLEIFYKFFGILSSLWSITFTAAIDLYIFFFVWNTAIRGWVLAINLLQTAFSIWSVINLFFCWIASKSVSINSFFSMMRNNQLRYLLSQCHTRMNWSNCSGLFLYSDIPKHSN